MYLNIFKSLSAEEASLSEDVSISILNRIARSSGNGMKKDTKRKKQNKNRRKRNKAKKLKKNKSKTTENKFKKDKKRSRKQKRKSRKNNKNGRRRCARQSGPDDSTCMVNIGTAMDYEGNQVNSQCSVRILLCVNKIFA